MGKIKGWKKTDNKEGLLIYESIKGNRIGTFSRTFQDWYSVFINGEEQRLGKLNKEEAKKYIIKYMRSHPNG